MPVIDGKSIESRKRIKGMKFLTLHQVRMIDDLLHSIGDFGEVHLEVRNGKLRFASRTESIDALKYEERK